MPKRGTRAVLNARKSRSTGWHTKMGKMQIGTGQNGWRLHAGILFPSKIPNGMASYLNTFFLLLIVCELNLRDI